MIGFSVVNLLIPGDPEELEINTVAGHWKISKYGNYQDSKLAICDKYQCAHTYSLENSVSMSDGSAQCDIQFDEITPILLGASFLSGLAVTIKCSLPHSEVSIIQGTSHWPRDRAMGSGNYCVSNESEFIEVIEKFIISWPLKKQQEKTLILMHHWLDALGCWSFEDFFLSATTLLQIVAATEEQITGNRQLSYLQAIESASIRAGITPLSRDFKDMRNNLIHEGKLLGGTFSGSSINECSVVAADLMNWFDNYIHSVLNLGQVKKKRHLATDFINLNAYSI